MKVPCKFTQSEAKGSVHLYGILFIYLKTTVDTAATALYIAVLAVVKISCNLPMIPLVILPGFPGGKLFNFGTHKPTAMKKLLFWSLIIMIAASGCRQVFGKRIRGNGHIQTETRTASSFNSVDVSGAIDVYVKQDSVSSIKVETDENLLQYIDVQNDNGTLYIHQMKGFWLKPTRSIKVYVSGSNFKRFEASGACDIISENKVTGTEGIDIDLSGASDVKMELKAPKVYAELSGAGTIELKGETKDFTVKGSGSTDIKCFELMAENVSIKISGAGDADVFASVKLDVRVSGAGSVQYRGNANVSQSVSGAGSVKKVE